jgi:hypothetical protein
MYHVCENKILFFNKLFSLLQTCYCFLHATFFYDTPNMLSKRGFKQFFWAFINGEAFVILMAIGGYFIGCY